MRWCSFTDCPVGGAHGPHIKQGELFTVETWVAVERRLCDCEVVLFQS